MSVALVQGGIVRHVGESEFDVHPDYSWVDIPTGTPVAVGWSYDGNAFSPPPGPTLDEAKQMQVAALAASYATACAQPVSFTTSKATKTFQADQNSRDILQQTLAGLSGTQATPPGFWWLSADNTQVPFTYADLQGLAAVMLAQGWAAFQHFQALKGQVNAATTVEEVQAIVSGARVLKGSAAVSGQPSGTNVKWRVKTFNAKEQRVHGLWMQWK